MVQEALECEQMEIWLQSLSEHADPFELYPIMFKNNNVSGGDNTEECAINTNKQKKIILNMEICEPTFRSVEVKDDHAKPVLAYMHSFEVGPRQVEGKVCRFSVEPVPLLSHRTRFIRIVSPREIEFGYIGLFSLHFHLPRRLHLDPCVQITLPETLKPTTESINLVQINRNFVIGKISQLDRTVCRSLEPSAFELLEDSPIDNLNNLYNDINSHVISTKQTISKILHGNR